MNKRYLIIAFALSTISYVSTLKLQILESKNGYVHAKRDMDLKLTCKHDGVSSSQKIDWYTPSSIFTPITSTRNTDKYYVINGDGGDPQVLSLIVRDVSTSDNGLYSCKYSRQEGNQLVIASSVQTKVSIRTEVTTKDCYPEQWIRNGSTTPVLIRCVINGLPAPTITWYRGSERITTGMRYVYRTAGLEFSDVTYADEGIYSVQAQQEGIADLFQVGIKVRVFQKPEIIFGPKIIGPTPGSVVMEWYNTRLWYSDLQCIARGNPPPTVHWFRKRDLTRELQDVNSQKFFVNTNGKVGKLRIDRPESPYDDDVYICVAAVSSRDIQVKDSDMVTQKEIRINITVPPQFVLVDRMHSAVDLGEVAIVKCHVYASGPIVMQFQKYNTDRPYVEGVQPDDPRITVHQAMDPLNYMNHSLTLTIRNTIFTDSWNYTCMAINGGGNYTYNATIHVWIMPNLSLTRDNIRFGFKENTTNITCIAEGLPVISWTWYRRYAPIINYVNNTFNVINWDYERHSESNLQIRPSYGMERWIFDEYRCNATNMRGTTSHIIHFRQASIPGRPIVKKLFVTPSTMEFKVTPNILDGGMPVLYFEIRYQAIGGQGAWYGPVMFPLDANIRLSGLNPETIYRIDFRSRNIPGLSEPYALEFNTLPSTVPQAVKVISPPMSAYPYSYYIHWIVPDNGGSPLNGYRIMIRPVVLTHPLPTKPINPLALNYLIRNATVSQVLGQWRQYLPPFYNPNIEDYGIIDIDPSTVYQVRIQAHNKLGFSPLFETTSYTPTNTSTSRSSVPLTSDFTDEGNFIFVTPAGDPMGRPPRIKGTGLPTCHPWTPHCLLFICFFSFLAVILTSE